MARAIVIGAGVAGLGTALALGRRGHEVTVLERDATPMPETPAAAFEWDRRGAPQVRHSHALLARLRNLLRDRHPEVLARLLDVGATEIRFAEMLPEEIEDRSPRPGDEDLVALACRRTTFEWIMREAVLGCPGVRLLDGVVVKGLAADAAAPGAPHVTGVHLHDDEGARRLDADLVVAANGRRSPLPSWLEELGVDLPEEAEDTGIIYYSRFYRLLDGVEAPAHRGPIGGDLGYLKYAVFAGDNRTFSITFAVQHDDRELRSRLLDPEAFDRGARLLPATAPWADAAVSEPTTEVFAMARLLNRLRHFTADGSPRALGFHAVGDAHTCTNPLYGRGCTLALVQAELLADALDAHLDDPVGRALAYEEGSAREVEPWYHAAVNQDRQNRRWVEHERRRLRGALDEADDQPDASIAAVELIRHGLLPAARSDAEVFRSFVRVFNLLEPPEAVMERPDVMATVLQTYQERDERPPEEPLGPPRREMLAGIITSAA